MRVCEIEGCDKPVKVKLRGLCTRHYVRWQRYGDPCAPRRKADPWTPREDELLRALPTCGRSGRAKPGSLPQLALELGRSIHALASRRHQLRARGAASTGASPKCSACPFPLLQPRQGAAEAQ